MMHLNTIELYTCQTH